MSKEFKADANALMNLEMMDSITGGASMCAERCVIACSESCLITKRAKNTEPPTTTPDPTKPTSES